MVSFLDSSIFPISPMFLLVPMIFAKPQRAFLYAGITTLSSVLGGIVGYILGFTLFELIMQPFLEMMGYIELYNSALQWFQQWGFWAVFFACFSPIPYKIFTIGAGVMQLDILGFLLASTCGRSLRFFLTAVLVRWGGPKLEPLLRRSFPARNQE